MTHNDREATDNDLSFDILIDSNINNNNKGSSAKPPISSQYHPPSLALSEYSSAVPKKHMKVGPLQFKPVLERFSTGNRTDTSQGKRVSYGSVSPHGHIKTDSMIGAGKTVSRKTTGEAASYASNRNHNLNQSCIEAKKMDTSTDAPITIIQSPQINNINNYNNININTIAIGQHVMPHPPAAGPTPHPPHTAGSRTNQFRMRKYKVTVTEGIVADTAEESSKAK